MEGQNQPQIIHDPISHPQPALPPCNSKDYKFKKHVCKYCGYRTDLLWVLRRHIAAKHEPESKEANKKKGIVIQSSTPVINGGDGNDELDNTSQQPTYNIQLNPNFKIFISGPSASGKTHFVTQLLVNLRTITKEQPAKVVYVYKLWQTKLQEIKQLNLVDIFLQGDGELKERLEQVTSKNTSTLLIFDDMVGDRENVNYISELFAVGRHSRLSLIFISQKIFHNQDSIRNIRENSDYYVLFKNPKNVKAVSYLGSQLSNNATLVADIYTQATRKPHSYLFFDVTQQASTNTQYLSNIFDQDHIVTSYVIDTSMNRRATSFHKMFLVSADKLEKIVAAEGGIQTTDPNLPLGQGNGGGNTLPPAVMSEPVKRKREGDSDDDDDDISPPEKRLHQSVEPPPQTTPIEGGGGGGGGVTVGENTLPQESVVLAPNPDNVDGGGGGGGGGVKRKRDIGAGLDEDGERAAKRQRNDDNTEEAVETAPPPVTSPLPPSPPPPQTVIPSTENQQGPFPFICEICNKAVRTAKGLKVHITRKHYDVNAQKTPTSAVKRKLSPPPEVTDGQIDIDEIARKKSRENTDGHCICKICNKHFRSRRLYNQHVLNAHVNVTASEIDNVMEDESEVEEERREKSNRKKAALNRKILAKKAKQLNNKDDEEDEVQVTSKKKTFARKKNKDRASEAQSKNTQVCNLCKMIFTSGRELKDHFISSHQ